MSAARALRDEILRQDPQAGVEICDALATLRAPLRWVVGDLYRWQLHKAPWLFGLLFAALRRSRLLRWLSRTQLSIAGSRSIRALVEQHPADVVVSTWPVTTAILGCLRLRGKLRVPLYATITDFAGLELWANRGVDLHLVMHESLVSKVEGVAGSGSARHVRPLVAGEFRTSVSRADARRALGLRPEDTVVVVSGGGWAVGDLRGAVDTALELGDVHVVCLAGRDEATRAGMERAFGGEPRVTVVGFTRRMSDLLAAADVLVHSTGGVTCLEALTRGCPIVAYGAPAGHTPLLAREMASLGIVLHARSSEELRSALVAAPSRPSPVVEARSNAASLVLGITPRVTAPLRARIARPVALAATVAALSFSLLASDLTYPIVAEALSLPESASIPTREHVVALVLRGRPADAHVFARVAGRLRLHASVAVSGPLTQKQVAELRANGLDPLPQLRARGVRSWFAASHQIGAQRLQYGLGHRFYYLAPREGFTIADYMLVRHLGGEPLQGHELPTNAADLPAVQAGDVVVASLKPHDTPAILEVIRGIARHGFAVTSVQRLGAPGLGS